MPRHLATRILAAALVGGLLFEVLVVGRAAGLNAPVLLGLLLAGAIGLAGRDGLRRMDRADAWLAPAALAFASFAVLRADPWLVGADLVLAAALTAGAVAALGGARITRATVPAVLRVAGDMAGAAAVGAVGVVRAWPVPAGARRPNLPPSLVPVARGVALALPVLLVFGLLFAAADAVFAAAARSVLDIRVDVDLGAAARVTADVAFAAWVIAGLLAAAVVPRAIRAPALVRDPIPGWVVPVGASAPPAIPALAGAAERRGSGTVEAGTVLLLVAALFAGFVVLQVAYLFGGRDTLTAAGLTYAEYARRGFFELVAVSMLAILLVAVLDLAVARRSRVQLAASIAVLALTAIVLVSALERLRLYQAAYGWTELRLVVLVSIGWLAVALLASALLLARRRTAWLLHVLGVLFLVVVAGLNAAAWGIRSTRRWSRCSPSRRRLPDAGDGWMYEPKWDGFRALVFRDGDEVFIQSRDLKPLDRYFPELEPPLLALGCRSAASLDGEVVIATPGERPRLRLAAAADPPGRQPGADAGRESPASFVAWDLLASATMICAACRSGRAARAPEQALGPRIPRSPSTSRRPPPIHRWRSDWFDVFEGAGLDGVIAKRADEPYQPGKRAMLKIKHERTADCVVAGFRWHKNGPGTHVGSLLLGLYDDEGQLHHVGSPRRSPWRSVPSWWRARAVPRGAMEDHPWREWASGGGRRRGRVGPRMPGATSRWNRGKDLSWEPSGQSSCARWRSTTSRATASVTPTTFRRWRLDRTRRLPLRPARVGTAVGTFLDLPLLTGLVFAAVSLLATIGATIVALRRGDKVILDLAKARPADRNERERQLVNVVTELAMAAGMPAPKVFVIDVDAPNAFAVGSDSSHASIAVTRGLLDTLDREELQGVVAHELAHVRNLDSRHGLLVALLVGAVIVLTEVFFAAVVEIATNPSFDADGPADLVASIVMWVIVSILAIVFAATLRLVAPLAARAVQAAVSRDREYLADATSVAITRNPAGLISALQKLERTAGHMPEANTGTQHLWIVNPVREGKRGGRGWFDTHPATTDRIARLRELAGMGAPGIG
jgi:Zn-dependent protease with chaperone function